MNFSFFLKYPLNFRDEVSLFEHMFGLISQLVALIDIKSLYLKKEQNHGCIKDAHASRVDNPPRSRLFKVFSSLTYFNAQAKQLILQRQCGSSYDINEDIVLSLKITSKGYNRMKKHLTRFILTLLLITLYILPFQSIYYVYITFPLYANLQTQNL